VKNSGTIQINKKVEAPFLHSEKKIILLYFGYVGCEDICSPFLMKLSKLYDSKEFEKIRKDVEVIFVNLTPEVQTFQPELFAKFFNINFKGVYLTKREILNIDRNFALFFSQDLNEKTELNHTDYLYLIQNSNTTFFLKNIYSTHPLEEKKLINDIISSK
jgi:protein SCO1/2